MGSLQTSFIGNHTVVTDRHAKTGITSEEYLNNEGKRDRTDGPAAIARAENGIVIYEAWMKDGKFDRAGGRAVTVRDAATGKVTHEEWWNDGKQFAPPAFVQEALAAIEKALAVPSPKF